MSESNEIKSYPFPPGLLSETEKESLMVRAKKILTFDEVDAIKKLLRIERV